MTGTRVNAMPYTVRSRSASHPSTQALICALPDHMWKLMEVPRAMRATSAHSSPENGSGRSSGAQEA